jgi:hypothetical protein
MLSDDEKMDIDRETMIAIDTFPILDSFCVSRCPADYVYQIMAPPLVSPHTNLQIEMENQELEAYIVDCHREGMTSSLWINETQTTFTFGHGISVTEIILRSYPKGKPISQMPTFIDCLSITSLSLGRGEPVAPDKLSLFPNLTRFTFIFEVSVTGTERQMLSDTLNPELPISCPKLAFIGMILRKRNPTSVTYLDEAETAVEYFLESWLGIHGEIFGTIRLQDEIKPSRWEVYIPLFEIYLESFELGAVTGQEIRPLFPSMREFTPPIHLQPSVGQTQPFRGFSQTFDLS